MVWYTVWVAYSCQHDTQSPEIDAYYLLFPIHQNIYIYLHTRMFASCFLVRNVDIQLITVMRKTTHHWSAYKRSYHVIYIPIRNTQHYLMISDIGEWSESK